MSKLSFPSSVKQKFIGEIVGFSFYHPTPYHDSHEICERITDNLVIRKLERIDEQKAQSLLNSLLVAVCHYINNVFDDEPLEVYDYCMTELRGVFGQPVFDNPFYQSLKNVEKSEYIKGYIKEWSNAKDLLDSLLSTLDFEPDVQNRLLALPLCNLYDGIETVLAEKFKVDKSCVYLSTGQIFLCVIAILKATQHLTYDDLQDLF